jgi:hypothetical protein
MREGLCCPKKTSLGRRAGGCYNATLDDRAGGGLSGSRSLQHKSARRDTFVGPARATKMEVPSAARAPNEPERETEGEVRTTNFDPI